jgi:hypothetical protein
MGCLAVILIAAVAGWFYFGSPVSDLADWVWPSSPAPWERVDAHYYPDAGDRSAYESRLDVGDLEACREAATQMAARRGDPQMQRGAYECGVGHVGRTAGVKVYRVTVK